MLDNMGNYLDDGVTMLGQAICQAIIESELDDEEVALAEDDERDTDRRSLTDNEDHTHVEHDGTTKGEVPMVSVATR